MKGQVCFLAALGLILSIVPSAEAFVFINEFLADPPAGLIGDANQDGVASSTQDEFVELYNSGSVSLDLTGWSLADGYKTRYVFAQDSVIDASGFFVVFGSDVSGGLGLNNDGDTITLFDAQGSVVNFVTYGAEGGRDQSLTLLPDGTFGLHSQVDDLGRVFSPGESYVSGSLTVDEKDTGVYLSIGLLLAGITGVAGRFRFL